MDIIAQPIALTNRYWLVATKIYCSNDNLLVVIQNYVGAQDNYRYTPSQAYRSHNRLLWPLPQHYCCLQYLSIDPEAKLLCPAIGIDPHNCRYIFGPIAYSIGYYSGYEKELNVTQTGRSKTLQAWASHHLVDETIHLKLLRAQQGQTALYWEILRWAGGAYGVDDECRTRADCTETGCLRAPLLSNTETKSGERCTCRYLSSETVEWWKVCRYPSSKTIELWKVYRYLSLETIGFVSQSQ